MDRHAVAGQSGAMRRLVRLLVYLAAGIIAGMLALVLTYRWVDPPGTPLMVLRIIEGDGAARGRPPRRRPAEPARTRSGAPHAGARPPGGSHRGARRETGSAPRLRPLRRGGRLQYGAAPSSACPATGCAATSSGRGSHRDV